MADNTTLNPGSSGDSIRDIDKGGVKTQVVTLDLGGSGAESLIAGTVPVSGQVAASNETGTIYNGTTPLTPLFASFAASTLGATTIVTGTSGKKIRVLRWRASANGQVNVNLQSHTTTAKATGLSYASQYKDFGGGYCPVGLVETVAGEALDVNLSAAVAVSGELTYILV